MDKDFSLFEVNREKLKRIFFKLSKNEKRINFIDFQRLCLSGKLIPNFISQNQLRALAGKFGNASVLTKLFLNYDQFEEFLKIISVSKQQPAGRPEKILLFFQIFGQSLRIQFDGLTSESLSIINRSNSSITANSELNESNSSLDLTIKEALNTLKSEPKGLVIKTNRVMISPRPVGRAYSNPSTPKSRGYKGFTNEAISKVRVSLVSPSQKVLSKTKNKLDLDEFLETEKLVQKEVSSAKGKMVAHKGFDWNKAKVTGKVSALTGVAKEKMLEKNIGSLSKLIDKHKKYFGRIQSSRLGKFFSLNLMFKVWVLETRKDKMGRKTAANKGDVDCVDQKGTLTEKTKVELEIYELIKEEIEVIIDRLII